MPQNDFSIIFLLGPAPGEPRVRSSEWEKCSTEFRFSQAIVAKSRPGLATPPKHMGYSGTEEAQRV
jgi:hypothetical protein